MLVQVIALMVSIISLLTMWYLYTLANGLSTPLDNSMSAAFVVTPQDAAHRSNHRRQTHAGGIRHRWRCARARGKTHYCVCCPACVSNLVTLDTYELSVCIVDTLEFTHCRCVICVHCTRRCSACALNDTKHVVVLMC